MIPMFVGCDRLRRSWIWADGRHHLVTAYQGIPTLRRVSIDSRLDGEFGEADRAVFMTAGRRRMKQPMGRRKWSS